jgi:hypothetical protein
MSWSSLDDSHMARPEQEAAGPAVRMSPENFPRLLERAYKVSQHSDLSFGAEPYISQNYRVLLHIPALQVACSSLGSLINLLYLVEKASQESPFSPADEKTYSNLISGIDAMLLELETALQRAKEHHAGIDSISDHLIRGYQNKLASFLEVLRR